MEISSMVEEIKKELLTASRMLEHKKDDQAQIHKRLASLEKEILWLTDRVEGLKMAADALELVETSKEGDKQPEKPVAEAARPVVHNIHHSRLPKRIGKFDPKGKKIAEYASINKAAKEFGWNNASLAKYIENVSKDKQIRLRGYYLQFIAA